MDLIKAKHLAEELLRKHKLDIEWSFVFDTAKRRFGCCNYLKKQISLSEELTRLNEEYHVRDTILHEIAHALVPKGVHHGKEWKDVCVRIGANPSATYSNQVIRPKYKYQAVCKNCGHTYMARRKLKVSCIACCKKFNHGRYTKKYKITFVKI